MIDRSSKCLLSQSVWSKNSSWEGERPPSAFPGTKYRDRGTGMGEGDIPASPIAASRLAARGARGCAGHSRGAACLERSLALPEARTPAPSDWRRACPLAVAPPGATPRARGYSHGSPVDCIVCAMILPQVHLRKPCYDFSFL